MYNPREHRNYKFRIYPTKTQAETLTNWLTLCRLCYNAALVDRKNHYLRNKASLTRTKQQTTLKLDKDKHPQLKEVHSQVLQEVLFRVEKAYQAFFRRVKAGENPGYPRYKGMGQYNSLTYTQFGDGRGAYFKEEKLALSKIGLLKIKLHREIPGKVKTCIIKRETTGKWYAVLSVEGYPVLYSPNWKKTGLDVGIEKLATLSDGEQIPNPKPIQKSEKKVKRAQRDLCRKKKGSKNREKARQRLAQIHERIRHQRQDYLHKIANYLVWKRYNNKGKRIETRDLGYQRGFPVTCKEMNKFMF
ncbi:RNA-guided endonuclease InsQ/TnpB family protein [Desulforamulus aeronauticus]|uniref:Transposase n=1 Tax=Desulforamulus aeronauticus DSM 10349 TaxID=1121421 RepID=A0A1M6NZM1_9FIRM|nr:RNA-guided endonuclease TnpB family protein [Desulforamulus aeronauticus]SHK01165.1 Transposase [Desulforamulus aeronauticus DSM 10349]